MSFQKIPIISLSAARDPATKAKTLSELRDALLEVGFLYLSDTGLPNHLTSDAITQCRGFFEDLPLDEKLAIEMKNKGSFLGYSRLGNEITAHHRDFREQLDLSTPHPEPTPSDPLYYNLKAPNQWPAPSCLPQFRPVFEDYMQRMSSISTEFTSLIAEAIGLPANAFDRFFDAEQQHKLKLIKYPEDAPPDLSKGEDKLAAAFPDSTGAMRTQGVGPHKDSMLTSYLLQASHHRGLQAQNHAGEWIDVLPIDGTLVVAIGQGLQAVTAGVCTSTTHRVLSPLPGEGARYSIPFFQGVSYDATFEGMDVPDHVLKLRDEIQQRRGDGGDDVEFTFVKGRYTHLGEATLMNRIKSHPDVGERWYPDLLKQIRQDQAKERAAQEADRQEKNDSNKAGVESTHGAPVAAATVEAH